jgi:hypothetical protein
MNTLKREVETAIEEGARRVGNGSTAVSAKAAA